MKLKKTCETCEFNFSGTCAGHYGIYKYGEQIGDFSKECDCWGADLKYYPKIINESPWYIRNAYKEYKIDYNTLLNLIEKDDNGEPIEVNIYDVVEEIYGLNVVQLANILDVSVGVITYAKNRGTIAKRVCDFSEKLCIPTEYFRKCTTKDFDKIKKCKLTFDKQIGTGAKKLNKSKSIKKVINLIATCLQCNIELATEFATISKIEWSAKTKLNNLNISEKKLVLYVTNKNQMKGGRLEKFTYWIDGNSIPRLNLEYKKK